MDKLKFCSDCRLNPDAKPPYAKMTRIPLTNLTHQLLEKEAKREKTTVECLACKAVLRVLKAKGVIHD
jgi:hypothetical protein